MFKKQITMNVEVIDAKIGALIIKLEKSDDEKDYEVLLGKIERLTELRSKLTESRVRGSNAPQVLSGIVQVASIFAVLHYEKTDIVTSKAFSMATRLFKESV